MTEGKELPSINKAITDVANTLRDHGKSVIYLDFFRWDPGSSQTPTLLYCYPLLSAMISKFSSILNKSNGSIKPLLLFVTAEGTTPVLLQQG